MGASISQRPGKCLKNTRRPRRSKSEECLSSKRSLTMGKLFAPWHHLVNVTEANAAAKMLELTAAEDDEFSYEMEKSFKQIHRSSSLDKSSLQNGYGEKVIADQDYSDCGTNPRQFCNTNERRLVIDVDKGIPYSFFFTSGSSFRRYSLDYSISFLNCNAEIPFCESGMTARRGVRVG